MTEYIALNKIRIDGGTQARAGLNDDVIADYAAVMRAGAAFAPIIVFHDGTDYWLADGFHRVHAAQSINADTIAVDIRQGDRREAILHSVGANAQHGLRRTNADKRRAVETLLRDDEWGRWSDREIARQCAVDTKTVSKYRVDIYGISIDTSERTVERNGKTYTMDTSNVGKKQLPTPEPEPDEFDSDDVEWLGEDWDEPEPVISPPPPLAHRFEHVRTVMTSSGSNEWYTPAHLIERARTFLGAIDLDPASSERANETVQAQRFYDARTDGLAQHWTGRISFVTGDGSESATATFPSVVVYLVQRHNEFCACFSEIGAVMRRGDGLHV